MPTKQQLTIIHTLLNKHKMSAHKGDIVSGFTAGRTESSREMDIKEAAAMIRHLKTLDPDAKRAERMRRKIISLAHEMNWKLPSGKIDMKHVDGWCIRLSYLHKKLDAYSLSELPRLVTQFENGPYKHYISTLK